VDNKTIFFVSYILYASPSLLSSLPPLTSVPKSLSADLKCLKPSRCHQVCLYCVSLVNIGVLISIKGFEQQGDSYRCITCLNSDPSGIGRWIKKGSLNRHMDSADHLNSIDLIEKHEAQRLENIQRLHGIYGMNPTNPSSSFSDPSPNALPGMFNTEPPEPSCSYS